MHVNFETGVMPDRTWRMIESVRLAAIGHQEALHHDLALHYQPTLHPAATGTNLTVNITCAPVPTQFVLLVVRMADKSDETDTAPHKGFEPRTRC